MTLRLNRLGMFGTMVTLADGQTPGNGQNINLGSAARFLLPCLLAIAYSLFPNAASAEGRCPAGMFETGSQDFIGCAPIPGQQGGDDGSDGESKSTSQTSNFRAPPQKAGYMAVAHHANTSSAWITVGHQSLDSARKRALDGCNLATRSGCYIADTHGSWGRAFVAMDAMGQLWIKAHDINYNDRHSRTRNQALAYCQQNSFGCENLADQQSGRMPLHPDPDISYVSDHFPEGPLTRNNWALVARPTKAPSAAWQNKSWLISGKQGSVATRKEILDRCQADSGVTCAISTYAVTDNALGGPKVGGQLVHLSIRPARTTGPVPCQRAQ